MNDRYLRVEGDQFVKDKTTSALLTVNRNVLLQNESRKKLGGKLKDNGEEINNLKTKINNLNDDITEIKSMLKILIDQKGQ